MKNHARSEHVQVTLEVNLCVTRWFDCRQINGESQEPEIENLPVRLAIFYDHE